jgi:hypothetical protein
MFNKKKKHWYAGKPNYKKVPGEDQQDNAGKPAMDAPDGLPPAVPAAEAAGMDPAVPAGTTRPADTTGPAGAAAPPETVSTAGNAAPEGPAGPAAPAGPAGDVICKICGMPIRNHYTAIRRKISDELTHFDCALRELSRENSPKLGKYKRIYYVGSGDFAIVKEFFDKRGHLKSYEILEKINYESKD